MRKKTINFHVSAVRTLAAPKRPCAEILLILSYLSLLHFLIANNSSMTSKQTSHILVNLFCNSLLSQFKMQVHINIST